MGRLEIAVNSLEVPPRILGPDGTLPDLKLGVVRSALAFSDEQHLVVFLVNSQQSGSWKSLSRTGSGVIFTRHVVTYSRHDATIRVSTWHSKRKKTRDLVLLTSMHQCCSASGRCSTGSDRKSVRCWSRSAAPACGPLLPCQFVAQRCLAIGFSWSHPRAQVRYDPVPLLMMRNSSLPEMLVPAWANIHWFSLSCSSFLFGLFDVRRVPCFFC